MAGPVRRVVVGPADRGGTVVRFDGAASAVAELPAVPGTALVDLWRSGSLPVPVPGSADPTAGDFELMPGGSLFRVIDLAPSADAEPMWHRTDSVDFIYVASGAVVFLHEAGEVALEEGDTIVVGAVRHAWVNRSAEVCRLVDVSVAAASPSSPS